MKLTKNKMDKMMHVLSLYDVAHHLHGMNLHIPAPETDVHLHCNPLI